MNTNSRCRALRALPVHVHVRLALLPRSLPDTGSKSVSTNHPPQHVSGRKTGPDRHWAGLAPQNSGTAGHLSLPQCPRDGHHSWHRCWGLWVPAADGAFPPTVLTSTGAPPTPTLSNCLSWRALIYNKTQQTSSTCSS